MQRNSFIKCSDSFFVDADYQKTLLSKGLNSIEDVFAFKDGINLAKKDLAQFRSRVQFQTDNPKGIFFLKRYDKPPLIVQIKNWLSAKSRKSCAWFDYGVCEELAGLGIRTAKVVSYGEQFGIVCEKRSFCITEKIPQAQSLEKELPPCFSLPERNVNAGLRKEFIKNLALFIRRFHEAGFRHRDLYLSHIFYNDGGSFFLIDLARTFKPMLFKERYRIKDIAQLYYSAPGSIVTKTDRLRFYCYLTGCEKIHKRDKKFIKKVYKKAENIARHDRRHGKAAPYQNGQ
jgi:hypothetical protein